jgi:hypothetical protein
MCRGPAQIESGARNDLRAAGSPIGTRTTGILGEETTVESWL